MVFLSEYYIFRIQQFELSYNGVILRCKMAELIPQNRTPASVGVATKSQSMITDQDWWTFSASRGRR